MGRNAGNVDRTEVNLEAEASEEEEEEIRDNALVFQKFMEKHRKC